MRIIDHRWCATVALLVVICFADIRVDARRRGSRRCNPSVTTVKGSHAPSGQICSGQLLLSEDFRELNNDLWKNEITMGGGGVSGSTN